MDVKDKLENAKKYKAEEYAVQAASFLRASKKIDIFVAYCEWISGNELLGVEDNPAVFFEINYKTNGNICKVVVGESVFSEYSRKFDAKIGIRDDMAMKTKIILRIAYLLLHYSRR